MRSVIVIVFIFLIEISCSQTFIVDDGFDNGTTLQSGWTNSGGLTSSSGSGNFGKNAPNIVLNTNAQVMTYSWTGASNDPDNLTFCYRAISGTAGDAASSSILIEESQNGLVWSILFTINTIQSNITSYCSINLSSTTRFIRLRYNRSGSCNTAIDDFRIRKLGSCSGVGAKLNMVNVNGGCTATTSCEGAHEIFFFTNGSSALNVNDIELGLSGPGGPTPKGTTIGPNATNTTAIWTNNAAYSATQIAYVSALNTVSGCSPGTFTIVPSTDLIPANARFLLFSGASPTHTFNFGSICSLGPFYVVFSNLDCTGKLGNGSCTQCYRTIHFSDNATGCVDTRTYTAGSSSNAGDGLVFDPNSTSWSNNSSNCNNFVALPIELLNFTAHKNNSAVSLNWSTATESNSSYFAVERSTDAMSFESIGIVEGAGNSNVKRSYEFSDTEPFQALAYYRLKLTDQDGSYRYSNIIAYDPKAENELLLFPNPSNNGKITLRHDYEKGSSNFIKVMDYSGKTIHEQEILSNSTELELSAFKKGVYILQFTSRGRSTFKKLVLN